MSMKNSTDFAVARQNSTWPRFNEDEIEAVRRVLQSGNVSYWTGDETKAFERDYADHCEVPYAVAVANGSVGLELALLALGVSKGDEVIVPSRTFVATASSVVLCRATPVFADVDRDSQNITAASIERVLTERTRAIIVVHLAGWPCNMRPILDLARSRNLAVIEDCAQAHGALYHGTPVGAIGNVGVFSFCQDKIITTGGEGGMLVTGNKTVWERAWSYKDHGKALSALNRSRTSDAHIFRWLHDTFGTNWRMTEMQAAIGRLQLQKLDTWMQHRSACASYLSSELLEIDGLRVTIPPKDVRHAYYKYYFFVEPVRLRPGWNRDKIVKSLINEGFFVQTGVCSEVYREKNFQNAKLFPRKALPVARELGDTSIQVQVDPTVTMQHLKTLIDSLRKIMERAVRRHTKPALG
jgi:dTDP-4-amino-4,6-dideoxygalactose transaminase